MTLTLTSMLNKSCRTPAARGLYTHTSTSHTEAGVRVVNAAGALTLSSVSMTSTSPMGGAAT